jgi:hypothetical protein
MSGVLSQCSVRIWGGKDATMRESMEIYPRTAAERAMKLQEVLLRATAGKIKWRQAAELMGISCGHFYLLPTLTGRRFIRPQLTNTGSHQIVVDSGIGPWYILRTLFIILLSRSSSASESLAGPVAPAKRCMRSCIWISEIQASIFLRLRDAGSCPIHCFATRV